MEKEVFDKHKQRMILDELYQKAKKCIHSLKHIELIDERKYSGFSHLKKILDDYIPLEEINIKVVDTITKAAACACIGLSIFSRYHQHSITPLEIIPWWFIIPSFYLLRSGHKDFNKVMEVYDETLYYEPLGEKILF
jgi:hypothetical protein